MSEYINKSKKHNSASVNDDVIQQRKTGDAHNFVDNRPGTVARKKTQEAITNSPHVQQLKAYQQQANNYMAGVSQRKEEPISPATQPVQAKQNTTGLPDDLKAGVENLSGLSMDNVNVHYNSAKPAQLNAHAYAQGTDIHVAAGQERHLPHEAWHIVQQKQGRVKPTLQMKTNVPVNDDKTLEHEADVMGAAAKSAASNKQRRHSVGGFNNTPANATAQRSVYRKLDSDWEKVERSDAPSILLNTLAELKIEHPGHAEMIENIFESDETRILLYRLDNKTAIKSEIEALIDRADAENNEAQSSTETRRRKGGDWRTGAVNKEFKKAAEQDKDGFDTGHHKLAKSKIEWLYNLLSKQQKADLRERLDLPSSSGINALKSLYSNLTFGPGSGDRDDDPKRELDPNHHSPKPTLKRTMTPRSLQYKELDDDIARLQSTQDRSAITGEEFARIARFFETAEKLHAIITKGGGLDTDKSMWVKVSEDWVKTDLPKPIDLPENIEELLSGSVRELKTAKHQAKEDGFVLNKADRERLITQLQPAHKRINAQLEHDPENIQLRMWKAMIMHEIMDLMNIPRN